MSEKKRIDADKVSCIHTTLAPVKEKELYRDGGHADYYMKFDMNVPETLEHVIAVADAIAEEKTKEAQAEDKTANPISGEAVLVKIFNGSLDLMVRAKLAPTLMAKIEGPSKTITKAAKAFAAAFGITEDEARAQVVAQMKAKGLPVE
jgi:hypothetical protein